MTKSRIILIYDCPFDKCDKLWVYHGLVEAGHEVKVIDWPFPISHIEQRGKIGAILSLLIVIMQSIYTVLCSRRDDTIFCWLQKSGIYCNKFANGKRNIISYNWLTPRPKKSTTPLYKAALENPKHRIVVNAIENRQNNLKAYGARDINNIYCIPDVYEENVSFRKPAFVKDTPANVKEAFGMKEDIRYCFMGGRANRDWKAFLETAKKCPKTFFVGVAAASDWNYQDIPKNVFMKFDTTAKEYYELMSHAYLAMYPLKEERVSGLINIIKGAIEGVPVLVTRLAVTEMYYGEETKDLLFERNDVDSIVHTINMANQWNEEEYQKHVIDMQRHIEKHFSPKMASKKIEEIIKSFACENKDE